MLKSHWQFFSITLTISKLPYSQAMWRGDSPAVLQAFTFHSSLLGREVTSSKSPLSQASCSSCFYTFVYNFLTWDLQQKTIVHKTLCPVSTVGDKSAWWHHFYPSTEMTPACTFANLVQHNTQKWKSSFASVYYTEFNPKNKNGWGLGTRLPVPHITQLFKVYKSQLTAQFIHKS